MIAARRGVLIGLLLALATLSGCSVEGRIAVESATVIDVDVTVRSSRSPYCNADIVGVSTIPEHGRAGVITACRYLGTLDPSTLGWALGVAAAGEYLVGVFNPLQVSSVGPNEPVENQLDAVDVTVVMPGAIQEANSGQVVQRELRITDPQALALPGGLRVVSLNHAGPPHWIWWSLGGALIGALVATVLLVVIRRVRTDRRATSTPAEDAAGNAPPSGPDAAATDTLGVSAAVADPDPPAEPDPSDEHPRSPWAGPRADSRPSDGPRQDPSRWAPDDQ